MALDDPTFDPRRAALEVIGILLISTVRLAMHAAIFCHAGAAALARGVRPLEKDLVVSGASRARGQ